jgi:hypothetical protein
MRWQVRHSKVRSSKPRSPGEIRVTPILCLQVRHIGRSTMDDIRIARHPLKPYLFQQRTVCPVPDSRPKFGASVNGLRTRSEDSALVHRPWEQLGLHGLGPESPYPLGPGSCFGGEQHRLSSRTPGRA